MHNPRYPTPSERKGLTVGVGKELFNTADGPISRAEYDRITAEREALLAKGGHKDDGGKDPWHLVPWDAVRAIVKILAFGAKKYADRNWETGMKWSRPYSALMRHLTAWWEGEGKDPETGYSHLWHAGCCILFLIAFELRSKGEDDRPLPER